jgi:hypothetical protein
MVTGCLYEWPLSSPVDWTCIIDMTLWSNVLKHIVSYVYIRQQVLADVLSHSPYSFIPLPPPSFSSSLEYFPTCALLKVIKAGPSQTIPTPKWHHLHKNQKGRLKSTTPQSSSCCPKTNVSGLVTAWVRSRVYPYFIYLY